MGLGNIRQASEDDLGSLVEVHESAIRVLGSGFYTPPQIDAWAAEARPSAYAINDDSLLLLIGEVDDQLVGLGQLNYDEPEIAKLFVDPDHAGDGVGSELLAELERRASADEIESLFLDASLNAINFYHATGYDLQEMLSKRLPLGDDEIVYPALRMTKTLSDDS